MIGEGQQTRKEEEEEEEEEEASVMLTPATERRFQQVKLIYIAFIRILI